MFRTLITSSLPSESGNRWKQAFDLGPALGTALVVMMAGCESPAPGIGPAGVSEVVTVEARGMFEGMVRVPGGRLVRGDSSGLGYADERPVREVAAEGFLMDRYEVTWRLWEKVHAWALEQGYCFDETYDFHPERDRAHPVCFVSWYDAVKWCNARSEKDGRSPVYFTDAEQTEVYRAGQVDVTSEMVDWDAGGYRLPTEAEWEWAARGGLVGQHYPWPSEGEDLAACLDGSRANTWESGDPWESAAECATSPVGYFDGRQRPSGRDMANGYGLYDMAGNVSEWCWDWYHDQWYEDERSAVAPARGPEAGHGRVLRGGGWISSAKYSRVSARYVSAPDYRCHCYGFRCVMTE